MSSEIDKWRMVGDVVSRRLREHFGISERHADEYADKALEALSEEFGGQEVYINKPQGAVSGAQLRRELLEGAKATELQTKYNLSPRSFYRYLEQGRDDA